MAAAGRTLLLCLFLVSPLLLYGDESIAPLYHVGEEAGWTVGINWPVPGQVFLAGGVLEFKYPVGAHNVVRVDDTGFETCAVPANPEVYSSGNDFVKLKPGDNYFICGLENYCSGGNMKIVVTTE